MHANKLSFGRSKVLASPLTSFSLPPFSAARFISPISRAIATSSIKSCKCVCHMVAMQIHVCIGTPT